MCCANAKAEFVGVESEGLVGAILKYDFFGRPSRARIIVDTSKCCAGLLAFGLSAVEYAPSVGSAFFGCDIRWTEPIPTIHIRAIVSAGAECKRRVRIACNWR